MLLHWELHLIQLSAIIIALHNELSAIHDSKVHGASVGLIWGWQDPGGSHIGPMNFAIWDGIQDLLCPSFCLSVCPSVCRWHGFWSITSVCLGISTPICIFLMPWSGTFDLIGLKSIFVFLQFLCIYLYGMVSGAFIFKCTWIFWYFFHGLLCIVSDKISWLVGRTQQCVTLHEIWRRFIFPTFFYGI